MSIRKREWTTPAGAQKMAWLVDYRDSQGKRRAKQFARKKDADAFVTKSGWEVSQGTHTADSQSITVRAAAENWLARGRREGLEAATLDAYDQHVRLHINPFIGARKLNQLTKPMVEEFRDTLLDNGRSRAMAKRVLGDLTSIIKEAERLGAVAKNVAHGVTVKRSGRDKPKVVPPTKEHLRLLISAAEKARPMDKPLLLVLILAGLRASEVRALTWRHVDLQRATITIDQRADYKNVIGPPKSASGFRTIPVPAMLVAELRRWKLRCAPSALDLVFPSQEGTPIFHTNLVFGFQEPLQVMAGLVRQKVNAKTGKAVVDADGAPVLEGTYSLHDFRHAAASLWIEKRVQPKRVQTWMGHHSIQVTFDTYGHLFAATEDDSAIMAALEADMMTAAPTHSEGAA